ncbi:GNAT acetyltransferase [Singulisphaera sp. GP187]|nr:GNAT acetyltransferase [Singulisphaera sp. GP187]
MLLLREGGRQLEAFGAGDPEPAVDWLCRRGEKSVALLAPKDWWDAVGRRIEGVEQAEVLTLSAAASQRPTKPAVVTRRLTVDDSAAFLAPEIALEWALWGWGTFRALVERGAGYVVPFGSGFAAMAWVYSQAGDYEAIGVSTVLRFRRLGLGKAAASALVSEIIETREKVPLWSTAPENEASVAMAQSLGFSIATLETFLRWSRPQGFIRTR